MTDSPTRFKNNKTGPVKFGLCYSKARESGDIVHSGKLFLISASSGAGKTTLVKLLIERLKDECGLVRVITYTTKKPRPEEVSGVDYHFLQEHDFKAKITEGFFLEYSCAYGAYYGFPRHVIDQLKKGVNLIAIVDRDGAESLKRQISAAVLVWIDASHDILAQRLASRGQDSKETIEFRLKVAQNESEQAQADLFHYVIRNENLGAALDAFELLIMRELGRVPSLK